MSSLPYLDIATPLIKYGAILTLAVNSLLIYLTNNCIKSISLAYKCLIVMEAVLGIVFSLIEILVHPFIHSYNASFIFFSSDLATNSSWIIRMVLLSSYSVIYMIILFVLTVQFYYRYITILSRDSLKYFRGWRIVNWLILLVICATTWVSSLNLMIPDDFTQNYWKKEMEKNYNFDIGLVASYQLVAYDEQGNLRLWNSLGLWTLSIILTILYTVILYYGVKTHYGMKAMVSVTSAKSHRLHIQLFKTLILQITVPTIFYNSPVFLMYFSPYLDLRFSFPSGLMICCFNFYPATDSLILMWMVGEYHLVIKQGIGRMIRNVTKWADMKNDDSTTEGLEMQGANHFTQYGVFLTLITNTLITNLTFSYVKNITFAYKCLIGLQAILGILFSLTEVLVHPFLHSYNASYIFFSATFASNKWMLTGTLVLALYSLIYMNIICCLAIQFIYRYFVVVAPRSLAYFRGCKMLCWPFYIFVLMGIWVFSLVQNLPNGFSRSYLKGEIARHYHADINYTPSFQIVACGIESSRSRAIQGILGFSSIILFQYIVILYCGIHIHLGIQSIATLASARVHRMHNQLFKTLVLQITVPSIFYNSPVFFLYILPFLDLKWSVPSGVMICVFSFYPAFDSLILLWMVTEYNRTMRKLLYNMLSKVSQLLRSDDEEDSQEQSSKSRKPVNLAQLA